MSIVNGCSDHDEMSASIDPTTAPIEDFYTHVNGGWLANHTTDSNGLEGPFRRARSLAELRLDALVNTEPSESPVRLLRDSYLAAGDHPSLLVTTEALGPELDACQRISRSERPGEALATLQRLGIPSPIELTVSYSPRSGAWTPKVKVREPSHRNPLEKLRAAVRQSGLTEIECERAEEFDSGLACTIVNALRDSGRHAPLARTTPTALLPAEYPGFPWAEWLMTLGVPDTCQEVVVAEPIVVRAVACFMAGRDLAELASWLRVRVVGARSAALSAGGTVGARQLIERAFSPNLAHRYSAKFGSGRAIAEANLMAARLKDVLRDLIAMSRWCTTQGRRYATDRVTEMTVGIGSFTYDSTGYDIPLSSNDLLGNLRAVSEMNWRRELSRIGFGRDTVLTLSEPYSANGLYDHPTNRLSLGLGLLEPPFFDIRWSDARKYASLGVVIGHEIAHGIDLATWSSSSSSGAVAWAEADLTVLRSKAQRLIAQCSKKIYEPSSIRAAEIAPYHVLNETICDSIGLAVAEHAFRREFAHRSQGDISASGCAAMQEFFVAWAWTMRATTDFVTSTGDSHPPARERCNWALRNNNGFHAAFRTKTGDPMWLGPRQRVTWWG
ncbi:M13-type metalloendopeptidase [Mycolicibacterium tusciae]|uniref:M13-type metalloendopeptidase n=1 Tax=Mycolicibacterium tusciae TaxID=75922 RepID=UPI00024A47D5|nr:M13-type metalloendopeptidase [Mycolicibacterium tusciae]